MERHNKYGYLKRLLSLAALFSVAFGGISTAQDSAVDPPADWTYVPGVKLPDWKTVGAVSSVSGDELAGSFTSNVANTLYGRLPGLTVMQSSGEPGADSPALLSRGIGTFGGGSGIHVVVDGFPSSAAFFQQLVPAEIESIQLLKDAAATAIYGNRGANGVLLVTTKKGVVSPLRIRVNARYGFQQGVRLPDFLGSYDYATLYNEALANEGAAPLYSSANLEAYRTGSDPLFHPDVDWQKEMLRSISPVANYDVSAKGGSETVRYFVIFNGINNTGLLKDPTSAAEYGKKQKFSRYNFRTNVDIKLSRRLKAAITLGGSVEDKVTPGTAESSWNLFDLMGRVPSNAFPIFVGEGKIGGNSTYLNPLAELTETGYVSYNGRSAQTSLRLTEMLDMITPGLSVSGAIGFNTYFKSYSNKTREYARYEAVKNESGETAYNMFGQDGSLEGNENDSYQWRNYAIQGALNYGRVFGRHGVNAVLQMNWDDYTETDSSLPYKNMGVAGHASYSFDEKYIAEFSLGYYGNENFPRDSRFGFFPAGAVGWIVSKEEFMKDSNLFDFLKLRLSYGMTGNSAIGGQRFMYNQYYVWQGGYNFGTSNTGAGAIIEGTLANPDVTWEKEKKLNVGIEAQLLGKLSVSFDYFRNQRYDILTQPFSDVPDWLGISLPGLNNGRVNNNGFELTAGWKETSSVLKWFVDGSLWYARNVVEYNSEAPKLYPYQLSTGRRIGQPFALEAVGFFRDQADIDSSPTQVYSTVRPGDIKYKDQNGDNRIDDNDVLPVGYTSTPEITLGLNLGAEYKGFDVNAMLQGAFNRSVYWDGRMFRAFQDNGTVSTAALGRWTTQTANNAIYPRLSTTGNLNNYRYSSFWQKNGNFLKLRSLELGYTLSPEALSNAGIESLRIYLSGTNLFSIDRMKGYVDPETLFGYPAIRTYNIGFNIQF